MRPAISSFHLSIVAGGEKAYGPWGAKIRRVEVGRQVSRDDMNFQAGLNKLGSDRQAYDCGQHDRRNGVPPAPTITASTAWLCRDMVVWK